LAVSSGGGALDPFNAIKHAFEDCSVTFVTAHDSYRNQVADHNFHVVDDANRGQDRVVEGSAQVLPG
jgi:hypothetical protein